MQYRAFGRLDWRPSALGFGCMRFPRHTTGKKAIDLREARKMLHYAIDHGVNYLDTAFVYGGSEIAMGKSLGGGYREKVRLATKMPVWDVKSFAGADKVLDIHLRRLQTDHIDFYLFHSLNEKRWEMVKKYDLIRWAEKKMAQGMVGHLGFSFHAGFDVLKEIIDYYPGWTFCQIQYNYLDTEYQSGTKGLEYAHSKGLGVVIMEPLRGGLLANPPEGEIGDLIKGAPAKRTAADWGLQWIWNRPEVSVVLSGMSTMNQVVENVASAERSAVGSLRREELAFVDRLAKAFRSKTAIPCTYCGYCCVCPEGLNLPEVFESYNGAKLILPDRSRFDRMKERFPQWPAEYRIDRCSECGTCEDVCSQRLPIREHIKKVLADLGVEKQPASAG